jgi:hypothetical protein
MCTIRCGWSMKRKQVEVEKLANKYILKVFKVISCRPSMRMEVGDNKFIYCIMGVFGFDFRRKICKHVELVTALKYSYNKINRQRYFVNCSLIE